MKRLAVASVALTALAVAAEAGSFPRSVHLVDQMRAGHPTHFVRGPEKGKKHGGGGSTTTEARQTAPAPKPTPQPARAD